ncbi:MAG: MBL fold metallo-hydrolase [Dermatophilaceae bacterium]
MSHEPSHLMADPRSGAEGLGHPGIEAFRSRGNGRPDGPIPLVTPQFPSTASDLALTWLGHASTLVEIEGRRFLLDPVFGERASPSLHIGPKRLHPAPCRVSELPVVDAVLISHDHYDHLDEPSIAALEHAQAPHYVVPIGVDLHLQAWGVPAERITSLDWREDTTVGGIRLTCTEARHFSGRSMVRNQSLWAGWALRGDHRSVWFAGDTGPTHRFEDIGRDLGPFDLTIIPIGAYSEYWPDIHLDPEQAISAHREVTRGAPDPVMVPVHWATFNLAMHPWAEPIRRAEAAAHGTTVLLACPRVGARIELSGPDPRLEVARHQDRWWCEVDRPEEAVPSS